MTDNHWVMSKWACGGGVDVMGQGSAWCITQLNWASKKKTEQSGREWVRGWGWCHGSHTSPWKQLPGDTARLADRDTDHWIFYQHLSPAGVSLISVCGTIAKWLCRTHCEEQEEFVWLYQWITFSWQLLLNYEALRKWKTEFENIYLKTFTAQTCSMSRKLLDTSFCRSDLACMRCEN